MRTALPFVAVGVALAAYLILAGKLVAYAARLDAKRKLNRSWRRRHQSIEARYYLEDRRPGQRKPVQF